jgi:thiamine biosynthesis lipoprotein
MVGACSPDGTNETIVTSATKTDQASVEFFAMNTYMSISVSGPDANQAIEEIKECVGSIENRLSKTLPDSEVAAINKANAEPVKVSSETYAVISEAVRYSELTDGAYDITVGPIMELWGFVSGEFYVPEESEIASALAFVDASGVILDPENRTVCLKKQGMQIDLGGIGKGYASNQIEKILESYEVHSATISLGGNVSVYGQKSSGEQWRIGITDPKDRGSMIGVVEIAEGSVITSGGYERYFEADGQTYIHIMDPKTGSPVDSDLLSVSIIGTDGVMGDCLSTALFVMGKEKAVSFWREHPDFSFVLCDKQGCIYVSDDLKTRFTASDPETSVIFVENNV